MESYQDKILGYVLWRPESSSRVDSSVFRANTHLKVFEALKRKIEASEEPSIEVLSVECDVKSSWLAQLVSQSIDMSDMTLDKFVTWERKQNQVAQLLLQMSKHVGKIKSERSPDEQHKLMVELKQMVAESSLESHNHVIESNPDLVHNFLKEYEEPVIATKTGINLIDNVTGGLRKGNFITILANSGVGKTNLMLNMAATMLAKGKKVLFFSLEMSTYELMERLFIIMGKHDKIKVRDRTESVSDLGDTAVKLAGLELYIISTAGVTSTDVIESAMQLHNKIGLDIVMVDYLQRLNDDRSGEGQYERITRICRALKNAAMRLELPIITPSQVDKQSAKGTHIGVENAVGSKAIGDESDLSLYLYAMEKQSSSGLMGQGQDQLFLKIVKNRHGNTGDSSEVVFDKQTLRMTVDGSGFKDHMLLPEKENPWEDAPMVDIDQMTKELKK